ncbi:MAG: metal ABC transporter permease [Planctomycetia bacterium]|nr:metal ABC transporter permease [Planctomycetia bacterium]
MYDTWLDGLVVRFSQLWPDGSFFSAPFLVYGLLAVLLVAAICGAVGSLVVGNRMAFFSDALAHTAFTGVALGLLTGLFLDAPRDGDFYQLGIPFIMVGFGMTVGLLIAVVRERTGLASDTVIGVFFAGVVAFGTMVMKALSSSGGYFRVDNFLWGDPIAATGLDLMVLSVLAAITFGLLLVMYNSLVFSSFNPSLARSRNISLRLCSFAFIVLLALIVNLSQKVVGVLLINGMLIVPAATAGNLCRNMRQLFWTTIGLSVLAAGLGIWLSTKPLYFRGRELSFGISGFIVLMSVLFFIASMTVVPWARKRLQSPRTPAEAKA